MCNERHFRGYCKILEIIVCTLQFGLFTPLIILSQLQEAKIQRTYKLEGNQENRNRKKKELNLCIQYS